VQTRIVRPAVFSDLTLVEPFVYLAATRPRDDPDLGVSGDLHGQVLIGHQDHCGARKLSTTWNAFFEVQHESHSAFTTALVFT
jgi:hypothetical protein